MSSVKWQQFCVSLNVLITHDILYWLGSYYWFYYIYFNMFVALRFLLRYGECALFFLILSKTKFKTIAVKALLQYDHEYCP